MPRQSVAHAARQPPGVGGPGKRAVAHAQGLRGLDAAVGFDEIEQKRRATQIVHVGDAPRHSVRIFGVMVGLPHRVILLPRVFAIPNRGTGESASVRTRAETRGLNWGPSCKSGTSTGFVRSRACGIIRPSHSFPNRIPLWDGLNRDSATSRDSLYTAMTSHKRRRPQRPIRGDARVTPYSTMGPGGLGGHPPHHRFDRRRCDFPVRASSCSVRHSGGAVPNIESLDGPRTLMSGYRSIDSLMMRRNWTTKGDCQGAGCLHNARRRTCPFPR